MGMQHRSVRLRWWGLLGISALLLAFVLVPGAPGHGKASSNGRPPGDYADRRSVRRLGSSARSR